MLVCTDIASRGIDTSQVSHSFPPSLTPTLYHFLLFFHHTSPLSLHPSSFVPLSFPRSYPLPSLPLYSSIPSLHHSPPPSRYHSPFVPLPHPPATTLPSSLSPTLPLPLSLRPSPPPSRYHSPFVPLPHLYHWPSITFSLPAFSLRPSPLNHPPLSLSSPSLPLHVTHLLSLSPSPLSPLPRSTTSSYLTFPSTSRARLSPPCGQNWPSGFTSNQTSGHSLHESP